MEIEKIAEELLKVSSEMSRLKINVSIQEFSRGELFVLDILEKNNSNMTSKEIEKMLNVSSARVATIVNQLEKKNYVVRGLHAEDNRKTVVSLTKEGTTFLNTRKNNVKQATIEMLEKLGKEDAMEYLRIQKKILEL